jgi:hypothetical protein
MSKKVLKTITAIELAKQLAKAKATQTERLRTVQLPVKAHTSGNAKTAIITSLILSGLALTGVVYNLVREAKKESDRKGEELLNLSFPKAEDVKAKVAEATGALDDLVSDAKEAVVKAKDKVAEAPVVKKVTGTAKKKADDVAEKPEVKEAADTVAEKTAEVAKAAREAKKDAEDDLGFPKK